MKNLFIGTSGFSYKDWIENFYPLDLASNQWLEYYSRNFKTLELNSPFYRLPSEKTFLNWKKRTPKDFLFSLKANQRITHLKRINIDSQIWRWFWERASLLGEKLGVILFQLPPQFKKDAQRLEVFLKNCRVKVPFAFEFRHQSWFDEGIFKMLKTFNSALVFHDAQKWPRPPEKITSDFVYLRFHGVEVAYNYCYLKKELEQWAKKIKKWLKSGFKVFAFFNNDVDCFAVKNARELLELVG